MTGACGPLFYVHSADAALKIPVENARVLWYLITRLERAYAYDYQRKAPASHSRYHGW